MTGRLSGRLYVAFAPFIIMGTLEAGARHLMMQLAPALRTDCYHTLLVEPSKR